ncbi:hypothetical protein GO755_14185 [Spirosoma sp. HMF4905]|uniref:Uncharacterized protein n=1 Tax=Spirosoma arboris TaxID=2682092 RepID=A0A7K1SBJ9_9BACT|nr:hypothetical protein [Spirosoma arboris]MVM31187.1 hypothetical protein [Spirosoma arboris]
MYLHKVRGLIAENRIQEAIKQVISITGEVNIDLHDDIISLSAQFEYWNRQQPITINNSTTEERAIFIENLLKIVNKVELEIDNMVALSREYQNNKNYHGAIIIIDKLLLIVEDESLRDLKAELSDSIISRTTTVSQRKEDFSFFWTFLMSLLLFSIPIGYFIIQDPTRFNLMYVLNIVLQISTLICMVLYPIIPRLVIDSFIKNADVYIRNKFDNRVDTLTWFSERANTSIWQFGKWWKRLGLSYLALYTLYYINWCVKMIYIDFPDEFKNFTDVIVNGSEGFFLVVLYRIVTDDTIKPSSRIENTFEEDLNYQMELGVAVIALFIFTIGSFYIFINPKNIEFGFFALISRTISGAVVSVGLCLFIGRLDSKFIEPKKWELWLLYLYAAIQLLFTLFDPALFKAVLGSDNINIIGSNIKINNDLSKKIGESIINRSTAFIEAITIYVLYFILLLKVFFIYFIINIYRNNRLFYFFLLGSKLNDEIKISTESANRQGRKKKPLLN